ncbi:MAG: hypothetical protein EGR83_06495 [Bacteroides cellulosilyticus]|nr:hypothetical protein [Bacteroides cellulosilyticus]
MHLLRTKAVVSSLRGTCEWRRYGASASQNRCRQGGAHSLVDECTGRNGDYNSSLRLLNSQPQYCWL